MAISSGWPKGRFDTLWFIIYIFCCKIVLMRVIQGKCNRLVELHLKLTQDLHLKLTRLSWSDYDLDLILFASLSLLFIRC